MGDTAMRTEDYCFLKDYRVEIEAKEGSFTLCFWVYLSEPLAFPAAVLRQVDLEMNGAIPFLVLSENKKMMLFPCSCLQKEAPNLGESFWLKGPIASTENEFPLEKWVHVGCEVSTCFVRLYIDGEVAGEQMHSPSYNPDSESDEIRRIMLVSASGGNNDVWGYIHDSEVLSSTFLVKDHYVKVPPLQLSVDNSSTAEIEVDSDGVWNVVAGKASCRRIFSLDVVLLNAFGQLVDKDVEVVASLLYADNGLPVDKTNDEETPLLASYDGIEFPSHERPSKLLDGRASFKLKISQLSSKCDNRLFHIKFEIANVKGYAFLEALSGPIRCISRSRSVKTSTIIWRKTTAAHPPCGSKSFGLTDASVDTPHGNVQEAKLSPSSKRVRLGEVEISANDQPDGHKSHTSTTYQVQNGSTSSYGDRNEECNEVGNPSSVSESTQELDLKMSNRRHSISDIVVFRYCLGGLAERCIFLKEVATTYSDEEISKFADQVSLYSGCFHHRHQIKVAKRMIYEGTKTWSFISQNNHQVPWESVVFEIEEQFMRIACCSSRSLNQQDFQLLRRVGGCREYLAQENFEKMWCWLYPVAFTLSRDCVKSLWNSSSPKWIDGFLTKEEAELSLQGPGGLQEPGTFILRFPTSRSWPHPDAGSLVVTYVGSDYAIHHRLLSLDYVYRNEGEDTTRYAIGGARTLSVGKSNKKSLSCIWLYLWMAISTHPLILQPIIEAMERAGGGNPDGHPHDTYYTAIP